MKMKYLCLAIYLAWSGMAAAETQQASAVSVVAAKSDDELREKEIELKAQEKSQAMMEKYLALHEKTITGQQKSVDWWIGGVSLLFAITSIAIPLLITRSHRREMEQELAYIKNLHSQAKDFTGDIQKMHSMKSISPNETLSAEQIAQNEAGVEAAKKLADNSEIPLIEQLRARAILLSNAAYESNQYSDYEKEFHMWYAVWLQNQNDAEVCLELGSTARFLYLKSTRQQQLFWLPEIEKWYRQVLFFTPNNYFAVNNLGNALSDEATNLADEHRLNEAYATWKKAKEFLLKATQIEPTIYAGFYNLGVVYFNEARTLSDEGKQLESYMNLQEATHYYQLALELEPNLPLIEIYVADSLSNEAVYNVIQEDFLEAEQKWKLACYHYEKLIKNDNDVFGVLDSFLGNLFRLHEIGVQKHFVDLINYNHNFIDKLISYYPNENFTYTKACLFSLENKVMEAIEQLKLMPQEMNISNGNIENILNDFETIRDTTEFQAWLNEAFPDTE